MSIQHITVKVGPDTFEVPVDLAASIIKTAFSVIANFGMGGLDDGYGHDGNGDPDITESLTDGLYDDLSQIAGENKTIEIVRTIRAEWDSDNRTSRI